MIYCDTSLLVTALTPEDETGAAQAWLAHQEEGQLCISGWTVTEFSCALSRKLRRGELSPEQRADVLTAWRLMQSEILEQTSIPTEAFDMAAAYVDRDDMAVRAGDALHLAIAANGGHQLASRDEAMSQAATAIGVRVAQVA